jgi:hypothetical protein
MNTPTKLRTRSVADDAFGTVACNRASYVETTVAHLLVAAEPLGRVLAQRALAGGRICGHAQVAMSTERTSLAMQMPSFWKR